MRKFLVLTVIIVMTLSLLAGCGGGSNSGPSCKDILETVKKGTEDGFDTMYTMGDDEYKDNFEFLYGITWDMIDDGGILYTESGGLADEISIVHLKDQGDISLARKSSLTGSATGRIPSPDTSLKRYISLTMPGS